MALRLLVSYPDLPRESLPLSIPKMLRQSFPDKFSPLVALSKMPSAFPSGTRFGRLEQFFYDSKFSHFSQPTTTLWYMIRMAIESHWIKTKTMYGSSIIVVSTVRCWRGSIYIDMNLIDKHKQIIYIC